MVSILTAFAAPTNSRDEKTMKSVSAWYYLPLEKQRQMSAQRSAAVEGGGLLFRFMPARTRFDENKEYPCAINSKK